MQVIVLSIHHALSQMTPLPSRLVTGIDNVFVSLEDEVVLVKSVLSSDDVQKLLESTGKLVVFRGFGGANQQG